MIAINGHSGFIGSALKEQLDENKVDYKLFGRRLLTGNEGKIFLKDVTKILFLSSPSDSFDFQDEQQMAKSMMDDYIHNLNYIYKLNPDIEIIFGSSIAVNYIHDNNISGLQCRYGIFKLAIEEYIKAKFNRYKIIRIPRVYGKLRTKGLMRKLTENNIETFDDKKINFKDIESFMRDLIYIIDKEEYVLDDVTKLTKYTFELTTDHSMTPSEIKWYYNL